MEFETVKNFFMWCTIINAIIFIFSSIMVILASNFVYKMQGTMFNISRESFNNTVYLYLGIYKIVFIVFNLVPFIALLII